MKNRLLAITQQSIPYIKELRPIAGSVTAALLWQQLDYWFSKYPDGFYKFLSPPDNPHPSYKEGDSWVEELAFSEAEFRSAFDKIGVRYTSKTAFKKLQNPFMEKDKEMYFASYQDKLKKMTFYFRNHELADAALDNLVLAQPKKKAKNGLSVDKESLSTRDKESSSTRDKKTKSIVDKESESGEIKKVNLPTSRKLIYPAKDSLAGVTENTAEIKTENTAEEIIILSKEEKACFEWAKKEPFWSKRVYSEEAFLKIYRDKKGTLKGQYENDLLKEEAEKQKNTSKTPKKASVKPVWELHGFKTEKEYTDAHLRNLKDLEASKRATA